ncbi:MAG: sigma-70 family RNA polymerase sigma factor [Thermoanaerobaculia bacterium]
MSGSEAEDRDELDRSSVDAVLAGRTEAFEGVVHRWQGPMIELAYRFTRDRGLAEDLAQEAFVKVFRSLRQWRGDGRFSTWLFAVATNVCRSRLRKKNLPTVPLEALEEVAGWRREVGDLEARERAAFVRDAVRSLPSRYRDAVVLFYFHDMDLRRAAESLGLPEGTVKSHLHRGRGMLQARLAGLLGERENGETG